MQIANMSGDYCKKSWTWILLPYLPLSTCAILNKLVNSYRLSFIICKMEIHSFRSSFWRPTMYQVLCLAPELKQLQHRLHGLTVKISWDIACKNIVLFCFVFYQATHRTVPVFSLQRLGQKKYTDSFAARFEAKKNWALTPFNKDIQVA